MEIVDRSEVDGSIWIMFILLHGHVCLLLTRGFSGPWFGVRNTQGVRAQQWQARDLIQSFLVSSESPCLCPQETIEQQHHLSLSAVALILFEVSGTLGIASWFLPCKYAAATGAEKGLLQKQPTDFAE